MNRRGERLAEREGFEPSDPGSQVNSLAVSPIRPLSHLSRAAILGHSPVGARAPRCPELGTWKEVAIPSGDDRERAEARTGDDDLQRQCCRWTRLTGWPSRSWWPPPATVTPPPSSGCWRGTGGSCTSTATGCWARPRTPRTRCRSRCSQRGMAGFEGRSSLRAGSHGITTNACLRLIARRPHRCSRPTTPHRGGRPEVGEPTGRRGGADRRLLPLRANGQVGFACDFLEPGGDPLPAWSRQPAEPFAPAASWRSPASSTRRAPPFRPGAGPSRRRSSPRAMAFGAAVSLIARGNRGRARNGAEADRRQHRVTGQLYEGSGGNVMVPIDHRFDAHDAERLQAADALLLGEEPSTSCQGRPAPDGGAS